MSGKINMFLSDAQIERDVLRQGDIIAQVHLLGAINLNNIQYSSAMNSSSYSSWAILSPPKFGDAIVLSHSCEIAPENRTKFTSIILAPLRDINTATSEDRVKELIESNLIDLTKPQASFLKYFYLPPNPNLKYTEGSIIDFSKCFSVRKQSYDSLVKSKIAQLSRDCISSLALKLALYFHRSGNN